MKRTIAAATAVVALSCAASANADTILVDLNSYAVGSYLDFRSLTPHPSVTGGGFIVSDPRGGNALMIDAGDNLTGVVIKFGKSFLSQNPDSSWNKYGVTPYFDVYAPQGLEVVLDRSSWTMAPGDVTSLIGQVKFKYGQAYLTNIYFEGGYSVTPEPTTWAMMIVGFGGVGMMLRGARPGSRRRQPDLLGHQPYS